LRAIAQMEINTLI